MGNKNSVTHYRPVKDPTKPKKWEYRFMTDHEIIYKTEIPPIAERKTSIVFSADPETGQVTVEADIVGMKFYVARFSFQALREMEPGAQFDPDKSGNVIFNAGKLLEFLSAVYPCLLDKKVELPRNSSLEYD
eukprot:TRINITY_DN11639_c0_g1_i1.p1 TRINITY_DN11639_c0_g1~~TRINITY_DN11639_c0_g1_i1.p1  ORF type:complete len:132 (-),score=15.26 TRINITY_DN11639_c0_g1_i1:132-527(-)